MNNFSNKKRGGGLNVQAYCTDFFFFGGGGGGRGKFEFLLSLIYFCVWIFLEALIFFFSFGTWHYFHCLECWIEVEIFFCI